MRCLAVGAHALLVLVDGPGRARAVASLVHDLAASDPSLSPPVDVVPAAASVLVDGLFSAMAVDRWRQVLEASDAGDVPQPGTDGGPADAEPSSAIASKPVVLPVTYEGEDIEIVAAAWGCSATEVVRRHQDTLFEVAFCGFAPGFAYCVSHPELPLVPRRPSPRPRVPAGSVALGGEFCAVYPLAMPGGWQVIGHTTAIVFDAANARRPALLGPGTIVRFESAT